MPQVTVNIPANLIAVHNWQEAKNPTWMDEWVIKKLVSLSDDKDIEDDKDAQRLGERVRTHIQQNPGDRARIEAIIGTP